MSQRKTKFAVGEYYHIYNRGVDKREIFLDDFDYQRFLTGIIEFNRIDPIGSIYEKQFADKRLEERPPIRGLSSPIVQVIAYCLNPNHFHLILREEQEKGIEKFMQKIGTSYTMYFNGKYDRSGALFQGKYKAVYVDSNEYLLYLSCYVNRNFMIHGYSGEQRECSSWREYIGCGNSAVKCQKDAILGQFSSNVEYESFAVKNADYLKHEKFRKYELDLEEEPPNVV